MKGIISFFYRIDILQNVAFFLAFPCGVFCVIYPRGRLVLFILAAAGFIFRIVRLGIPTAEEILKHMTALHTEYAAQVMREKHEEVDLRHVLDGFSEEKAFLCRQAGVRAIYPVCRTVLFSEEDGKLVLYGKDTPLMHKQPSSEWQVRFSSCAMRFEKKKNAVKAVFSEHDIEVSILLPNKFKLHELLPLYQAYLVYDKEAFSKL